jgi:hypothetical protein
MVQADVVAGDNLQLAFYLPGVGRQRYPGIVDFIKDPAGMRQ